MSKRKFPASLPLRKGEENLYELITSTEIGGTPVHEFVYRYNDWDAMRAEHDKWVQEWVLYGAVDVTPPLPPGIKINSGDLIYSVLIRPDGLTMRTWVRSRDDGNGTSLFDL